MKVIKSILLISMFFVSFSCKQNISDEKKHEIKNKDSLQEIEKDNSAEDVKTTSKDLKKNCNESFDDFFERFSKDSVFQKQRIKYPLKWSFFEESYDELTISYVKKKDFTYMDFSEDKNAMQKESGKYEIIIKKNKSDVDYLLKGYDNGLYMSHKFKLEEGCWYLVEIVDKST